MRIAYYAGASTAAAAACLLKAFHERPNFYSATVYLSQSNACLLILTNLLLVGACAFMFALQRLLYGPLRPIEVEHLSEKAWYAVLDTLLAMPSFREDVGGWLLTMFVLLLAGKVWSWIGEGRVDILEQQPPANPRLFHIRLATSLVVSVLFNAWMAWYCVDTVMANPRPGMMVIFTFEFAIQIVLSTFTLLRYCLAVAEIKVVKQQTQEAIEARKLEIQAERAEARQNQTEEGRPAPASPVDEEPIEVDENEVDVPGWEDKRRWLFGLEVTTDFIKLMIYVVFLTVSITFNGLPMHIMRDVYLTFASFMKRVNDYMQYRRATSDMNTRYPDATTEEIRGDACIVCRENMFAWEQPEANAPAQPVAGQPARAPVRRDEGLRAKKLPCGHILHLRCLKSWLERQQMCPTCRRPVVTTPTPNPQAQAGAAQGANPAAPQGAQQGQPPNGRPPVRARFFNLGPVRIGFANGPAGQMNDIVNQLRNPQAQAQANQAGAQPVAQQGPNHLGLQEPYLPQAHGAAVHAPAIGVPGMQAARPVASTQLQLMQIEQRILQDAQNLQLEQQQVALLRVMEAEMARLRAQYAPTQQLGGAGVGSQYQSSFPTTQEVLHGANAQSLSNGNENLPQGLVLPEGWTLMPLHRQEGAAATSTVPTAALATTSQRNVPDISGGQSAPPHGQSSEAQIITAEATEQERAPRGPEQTTQASAADSAAGPTDERGSPLFVPTAPVADAPAASSLSSETLAPSHAPSPQSEPQQPNNEAPVSQPTPAPVPWSSGSWGFDNPATAETTTEAATDATSSEPSREPQPDAEAQDSNSNEVYAGKGKGRAVEVEDAPDQDA
jgi:E3 ubiquitin-protein ligase synoviolin